MTFDTTLKRFFPAIVCVLIAMAAYFQASGIGDIVGSAISDTPASKPVSKAVPFSKPKSKSAKPILARNPFDSVTGPLDGRPSVAPASEEPQTADGSPEDQDPACTFGRVGLIMASDDPAWSFASIDGDDGRKLRRVGDQVNGHTIEAMGWDRVWFVKDRARCQIKVNDRDRKPKATKKPPLTDNKKKKRRRSTTPKLDDALASKIQKISDNEFKIERSVVDQILEKQAELMRYTRMRPVKDGDKVVGLRMSRIRKGTLLDVLGLKNGDQIQSINGFDLTSPQTALEAYGRLRTADSLKLAITRGGGQQTIEYRIQ